MASQLMASPPSLLLIQVDLSSVKLICTLTCGNSRYHIWVLLCFYVVAFGWAVVKTDMHSHPKGEGFFNALWLTDFNRDPWLFSRTGCTSRSPLQCAGWVSWLFYRICYSYTHLRADQFAWNKLDAQCWKLLFSFTHNYELVMLTLVVDIMMTPCCVVMIPWTFKPGKDNLEK